MTNFYPPPQSASPPSGTPKEFAHTTVLIVDDDATYRYLLRGICSSLGVGRIAEATDGQSGLDTAERLNPDMILLDIMMPGMDGFDVCRALRQRPQTVNTAVLVQTGLTDPDERTKCFDAGATDVVSKPLNLNEFTVRVRTHLRQAIYTRQLADYSARIATHLSIAGGFMSALLPDVTATQEIARRNGFELTAAHRVAEELGGDIWYLHEIAPGKLLVLLLDASAHGLAGAINAMRIDTLLRELWQHHSDPQQLLLALDHAMAQSPCDRLFAAVTAAILDNTDHTVMYAASGNPHPILCHGGESRQLSCGGLPLGSGFATLELNKIAMEYDDILIMHTDGWPPQNDVNPVILINHALSTGALNADLLTGSDPVSDDMTLLTIRSVRPCPSLSTTPTTN